MKTALLVLVSLIWRSTPLFSQSESVSGLVVAADGTSVAGVPVTAKLEGTIASGLPTIVTQTDRSGQYRFESIPPGTYIVRAGPDGGSGTSLRANIVSLSRILFDEVNCDPGTGRCSVPFSKTTIVARLVGPARLTVPDKTNAAFNIMMLPTAFAVSGHLSAAAGITIPPLKAHLTATTSQLTADTDVLGDGTFEIMGVPPGTYVLRIVPNLGIAPETITITDQNRRGIELGASSAGVRVNGSVLPSDLPLYHDMFPEWVYLIRKDATEVEPTSGNQFFETVLHSIFDPSRPKSPPPIVFADETGNAIEAPLAPVGPDGRFDFLSVPAGKYYVRTLPEIGIPNFPITVVGDKAIDNVRVGEGVRVRGELVSLNLGTRPPELIRLTATGFKGQSVSAEVKADGSFEFPRVGPGTYQILLDNKIRPKPAEVTIGEEDLIVRVEAPFKVWVAGRVVFAGSIPPAEILSGLRVGMNNGYDSEVKPDGSFQIKSNEGEYEFFLRNLPEGCVVKSISDGTENLMMEPVKVDLSSPPREILVTLEYKPVPAQ